MLHAAQTAYLAFLRIRGGTGSTMKIPLFTHILFALCVANCFLFRNGGPLPLVLLLVLGFCEIAVSAASVKNRRSRTPGDIGAALFGFIAVWQFVCGLNLADPILFPPPAAVFQVFWTQRAVMALGVLSSLNLLALGFLLALPLGALAGMAAGLVPRLRGAVLPVARVLAPISPIIYAPYLVAIMPSFRAAAAAVIFIGIFLPALLSMSERAAHLDPALLEKAKLLRLSRAETVLKVAVPYLFPGMLGSLRQSFSSSFMLLTMAEMLGSHTGMGYFIRKFADYADYTKVAAGILLVAAVVTVLNKLLDLVQGKLVRWR
jgi:NitT/TauT family transport system permease protein